MPVYKYRGVTEKGQVISNRIEMDSKQKVIDKLKENNIMPIDITQVGISLRKNKQRKNMAQAKEIFKEVNMAQIKTKKEAKNKPKAADSIKKYFEMNQKVTTSIIIIPTNCKILGINIFFIFLVNSVDSSKYLTACSNEFDSEPDNSPTFIIFVYMYGNTFE